MAYSKRQLASGSRKMRFFLLLVGLAAAAEVRPGAQLRSSHHQRAPRATPSSRRSHTTNRAQVIRDKKEAEQVAKKLFKDHKKDRSPKKVKDARKAFKKEEAVKLTRGGGPPIPKPPADGEPPSEEEARRRARRLMRRMSRKRKGKKHHKKSKAFKKGML